MKTDASAVGHVDRENLIATSHGAMVPEQLHIETSNICNADCVFCTYRYDQRKKKIMGINDFRRIVEEYKTIGGKIVNFTPYAGEVFTDREFLDKVRIASDLGFEEINTYSNVTLIDKFGIDQVLQSGLTYIAISTSPLEEKSYKEIFRSHLYRKMLDNMVALIKRFHEIEHRTIKRILISFRSDRSLEEIEKLPDYQEIQPYLHHGVCVNNMQEFDSWMGMIKDDDLLPGMSFKSADFDKPLPCDRLYMLKVTSNGKMRACGCRYDYSKSTDDFYIGNAQTMGLLEAYNSEKVKSLKKSFYEKNIPSECEKCAWYESFRYEGK